MSEKMQDKQYTFEDYRRIVDTLRSEEGCPWDRAQTKESLKPFMIEEMVEAAAAVNTNDMENLCEELGDQLAADFTAVQHCQREWQFFPG